jgi:hypothetical protein
VAFVLLIASAGWVGLRLAHARDHLLAARSELEHAKAALNDDRLTDVDTALARATHQTGRARQELDDPLVALAAQLPLVGRTVSMARSLATVTDEVARQVLPGATDGVRLLTSGSLRRPDGSVDLARFVDSGGRLGSAAATAHTLALRVRALPHGGVFGAVADARSTLQGQLDELDRSLAGARDATVIAPRFLGADRPRTYFVLIQQTSESRGTGGLPGGFAVLKADQGRLTVLRQGTDADLVNGQIDPVGLPADVTEQYGEIGAFELWQNINLSPDLPTVARYVTQRWKQQTGQVLDGVITLDAVSLADLLQGSGPITLAGGRVLQPAQLPGYLAIGQYVGVDDKGLSARKQGLVDIASQVLRRLTQGGGDTHALLTGMRSALSSGHLRMSTDDSVIGPLLHDQQVDGGLPGKATAFVYPVVFNAAGDKLDYFLNRTATYERLSCKGDRRRTRVTVTLRTDPPALAALPPYVTISEGGDRIENTLTDRFGLSVYATAGSTLLTATLDGKPLSLAPGAIPHLEAWTEAGLPLWRTYVFLPPHRDLVLALELDEPDLRTPGTLFKEQPLARAQRSSGTVVACRQ